MEGNYDGLYQVSTGQLDPNINSDFDLVSLTQNRNGPLPLVALPANMGSRGRREATLIADDAMIDAGYRATRILEARLAHLRRPEPTDAELMAARTPSERTPVITAIRVENDSKVGDDVIRYYIRQQIGEPLDLGRLQTDMGTLYGLDYFEQVQYRVVHKGADNTLVISARGRRTGNSRQAIGNSSCSWPATRRGTVAIKSLCATSRAAAVICAITLLVAAMLASPPACSGNTHCAVSARGDVASLTNAAVIAPPSRK